MKYFIAVLILTLILILITIQLINDNHYVDDKTKHIIGIILLDREITPNNEYRILYEIHYSDGTISHEWKYVDYNDFIDLWEENRYEKND